MALAFVIALAGSIFFGALTLLLAITSENGSGRWESVFGFLGIVGFVVCNMTWLGLAGYFAVSVALKFLAA